MEEHERGRRGLLEPLPDPMPEDADDVLTRLGLVGGVDPSPSGRAARRRSAENGDARSGHHARPDERRPTSHAATTADHRQATNHAAEEPADPHPPRRNGRRHSDAGVSRHATPDPSERGSRRHAADDGDAAAERWHRRDSLDAPAHGLPAGYPTTTRGPEPGGRADGADGADPYDPGDHRSAGRDTPISQPSRPPPDPDVPRRSTPAAMRSTRASRDGATDRESRPLRGPSEPPLHADAEGVAPPAARHAGPGYRGGRLAEDDADAARAGAGRGAPANGHGPVPDDPPGRPDISGLLGLSARHNPPDESRAGPDVFSPTARHSSPDDDRNGPDLLADPTRAATHRDPPPDDSPAWSEHGTTARTASRRAGTRSGRPDQPRHATTAPSAPRRAANGSTEPDQPERATSLQPTSRRAASRTDEADRPERATSLQPTSRRAASRTDEADRPERATSLQPTSRRAAAPTDESDQPRHDTTARPSSQQAPTRPEEPDRRESNAALQPAPHRTATRNSEPDRPERTTALRRATPRTTEPDQAEHATAARRAGRPGPPRADEPARPAGRRAAPQRDESARPPAGPDGRQEVHRNGYPRPDDVAGVEPRNGRRTRTDDPRTELPGSASRRGGPSDAKRTGEAVARPDSARPDSARPDSARPDSARPDSARPDRDSSPTQQLRPRDIGPALAGRRRATSADNAARENTDVPTRVFRRNGSNGTPAAGRSSTAAARRIHEQLDSAREDPRTAPTTAGEGTGTLADLRPSSAERARRIDATLTRLTAAHAGIVLARPDDDDVDDQPTAPTEPVLTAADSRAAAWERRRRVAGQLLVVAAVTAIVFAAGTGWAMQQWLDTGVRTVAALDTTSSAIVDAAAQQGAENVLLVSTAATNDDATRRPDTVAVVHVPADGGPVTVVTVPAELQVGHPDCDRFEQGSGTYGPDVVPAESDSTLSNALAVGGPRCVTMAMQALTGLAVTRYVGVDLDALGVAVGAVSGITVCVPRPVVDSRLGAVAPKPGTVALNAATAGAYVHAADVESDPPGEQGTVTRQQQVLAAVLGGTLSNLGLLDVSRVSALRAVLATALVTDNAALDQVLALAQSVGRPAGDDLTFRTVPSSIDPQGGGLVPVDADSKALFAALRTGAPLPAVPSGATPAAVSLADVHIDVLNASDKPGEAARIGAVLSGLGFGVGTVANAPSAQDTVIRYSPDQAAAALVLAASVPAASTEPDPDGTGMLQLVLGTSFDSVVKPPGPSPVPSPTPAPTDDADDADDNAVTCA